MIIPAHYTYLIGSLLTIIPWAFFFIYKKALRKEILIMSILWMFYGVFFEYFLYIIDWWHPHTITGTKIGIEDFILAFTTGGIITSAFEILVKKKRIKIKPYTNNLGALFIITFNILITLYMFYILQLSSPIATNIGLLLTATILLTFRKDLILYAFLSGVLILIGTLPFYYFLMLISKDFLHEYYQVENLSKMYITGIPIEDLLFYFLAGLLFAPFFKFWKNETIK